MLAKQMMNQRKVITIDGLAASGKTTIARKLAEKLGFVFFSSGLIYRAVGYLCIQQGINPDDAGAVAAALQNVEIDVRLSSGGDNLLFLDNKDITGYIFKPEISEATSRSARHADVRQKLFALQRNAFPGQNLVAEGRDMGTVVFPDAEVKFFITASTEAVIERRIAQMAKGKSLSEAELNVLKSNMKIEITERDQRDKNRRVAPSVPAVEAVVIDNSSANLTETLDRVYSTAIKGLNT